MDRVQFLDCLTAISHRLPKFKDKGNDLYNFRCVLCGDSKRNKSKARAYIYFNDKNIPIYHCHNCGASKSFAGFLKEFDPTVYSKYLMESFGKKESSYVKPNKEEEEKDFGIFGSLPSIDVLSDDHPAKEVLRRRKIPIQSYSRLFYSDEFEKFVNGIIPKKFEKTDKCSKRIVIPLQDKYNRVFGFQGRDIDPATKLRYITIMLGDEHPRIFGLDRLNQNETFYVLEGPFDSLFVNNAIAVCGSSIHVEMKRAKLNKDNMVIVYDNEPRNQQIMKQLKAAIDAKFRVVIWPKTIKEKDINDMILKGETDANSINKVLSKITYRGLEAQLQFNLWSKVNVIRR